MTIKGILECERRSLEKMKKLQLPNRFKVIGIGVSVVSLLALLANALFLEIATLSLIGKYMLLIGLFFISLAREKVEDERVATIRMRSYFFAFIIGVFYTLAIPFIDFLFDYIREVESAKVKEVGDFMILWVLLTAQITYFEILKRSH